MSNVQEIKAAIDRLSPEERRELEAIVWPEWDRPMSNDETPPGAREKLAEAQKGKFVPGDRANIAKILSSLE